MELYCKTNVLFLQGKRGKQGPKGPNGLLGEKVHIFSVRAT